MQVFEPLKNISPGTPSTKERPTRLSLFGAYAQSSLASDPSSHTIGNTTDRVSSMHAPHTLSDRTNLEPLLVPAPSACTDSSVEDSVKRSGKRSAQIAPCWSASDLSVENHPCTQDGRASCGRSMHDALRATRCSVTRVSLPSPTTHAPHACDNQSGAVCTADRHETPGFSTCRPKERDTHGTFWKLFRSQHDQKCANTSRRFATREHAQLHQVECSLASVTQQLRAQRRKLKSLQAQLAAVVSTLDTLIVSKSVAQQLFAQARVRKMQRLCRRHGQFTTSMHSDHACGVTPAVQASMHATQLAEDLMHDVENEIVRVRDMGWQQCMEYEWGVRGLVVPKEPVQQRTTGMHVKKWSRSAARFVRNLFRGRGHGASSTQDQDLSDSQSDLNRRRHVPASDVATERCRNWQRCHMLRLGGMSRQQG